MSTLYDIPLVLLNGQSASMADFRGQVILVVNVASRCGFTPQYAGLQSLYLQYQAQGFVVLGFPCNQFGSQESGSEDEIAEFCSLNYGVSFPIFAKTDVNGEAAHPLYQYLKSQQSGFLGTENIKWNFTKFLIDREGRVVSRHSSMTKPEELAQEVESLL
ncbi:glutathione peroxidase [Chitinibacter bivalviorum]|uniref:Glutathione peroxidase n=1 Tax=Chitinibacter bivalviorum TaxID=2739434 RepID=A0A7H9BK20_9NEIS|nr:glutathione peroxidase [Chitinibacter bivalviorum]QLG88371.1 glutathione peroxidase [Chitinibacter bivalviorum]